MAKVSDPNSAREAVPSRNNKGVRGEHFFFIRSSQTRLGCPIRAHGLGVRLCFRGPAVKVGDETPAACGVGDGECL